MDHENISSIVIISLLTIAGLDGIITFESGAVDASTRYAGWNMVGFPSLSSKARDVGLNNLAIGTEIGGVYYYEASSEAWVEMGTEEGFTPGYAYRIYANADCVWDVPV